MNVFSRKLSQLIIVAAIYGSISPTANAAGNLIFSDPRSIPQLELQGPDGQFVNLSDIKGKVLVLSVWATWCVPCREEFPSLDRMQGRLRSKGLVVIPVSVDKGGWTMVNKFYSELKIKKLNRYLFDDMGIMSALGMQGLPTTIILNKDRREVARVSGGFAWDSPESIEKLEKIISSK